MSRSCLESACFAGISLSSRARKCISVMCFRNGGGGIRTHEALARLTVFKTVPFDRSGTPPEPHCDGYRLIWAGPPYSRNTSLPSST